MWVKNLNTGMSWWVEGELLERLSRSPEYEVIDAVEMAEPQSENENLDTMTINELRALSKDYGVEIKANMKKAEIVELLQKAVQNQAGE